MAPDLDASSLLSKSDGDATQAPSALWHRWKGALKYIALSVALLFWIAAPLLSFSHPSLASLIVDSYFICVFFLVLLFVGAAFHRRARELAVLSVILAIAGFPYYVNLDPLLKRLYAVAFRMHVSPVVEYLPRCRLYQFTEKGVGRTVGVCERRGSNGDYSQTIAYDTTGELALPPSQRTPEWREAMRRFSFARVLMKTEGRADHLFGNFYEVITAIADEDGAGDDD